MAYKPSKDRELVIKMVLEMYSNGFTYPEIARAAGIKSLGSISFIIKTYGDPNRQVIYTDEQIDTITEYWRNGLTYGQIAIKMKLTRDQVKGKMQRLGLID